MKKIVHILHIRAAAERISQALITEDALSKWWTKEVSIREDSADDHPHIHFRFLDGFNPVMKVVSYEHGSHLEWEVISGADSWIGSRIRFEIQINDTDRLPLIFRHTFKTGLSEEEFGKFNFGWGFYLQSLRTYLETGEGSPFDPENN